MDARVPDARKDRDQRDAKHEWRHFVPGEEAPVKRSAAAASTPATPSAITPTASTIVLIGQFLQWRATRCLSPALR